MDEAELPLLHEPLPVELANTLYRDGDSWIEFLADAPSAHLWLRTTAPRFGLRTIRRPSAEEVRALRVLRDAVRMLFAAVLEGGAPDAGAVDTVNRWARGAPASPQLEWADAGPASIGQVRAEPDDVAVVLTTLAEQAIELVGGPRRGDLRRCQAPGCAMYFVKDHPRRAWCNPGCGHRARQARYYRRKRASAGRAAGDT